MFDKFHLKWCIASEVRVREMSPSDGKRGGRTAAGKRRWRCSGGDRALRLSSGSGGAGLACVLAAYSEVRMSLPGQDDGSHNFVLLILW